MWGDGSFSAETAADAEHAATQKGSVVKIRSALTLVLDANPDIVSKKGVFEKAWKELYPGLIEYRPNSELLAFDDRAGPAKLQFEDVKGDVFNIIAPQRVGAIASPSSRSTSSGSGSSS